MARKYYSDLSGERVPEKTVTILRVNKQSPVHSAVGAEVHLSDDEALSFLDWLGRKPSGPPADLADDGLGPKPAPRKPRPKRSA